MTKPIIPEAALSQHIAVLGKTGSGKTFAMKAALVEPALAAGRRVAIVDPTAAWWGLRSSRDGRGAGFPILVLGGDHGDLPLPALGGAAVARLIAEQGVNLVADTSLMTVGERTRWFIDFAGTLYRLNRAPLQLVLDEAHMFAPQGKTPDPDAGRMLHAANTLGSAGRSRGIRVTMITQRPAKLHKDLLTCADTLIAMRVLAPQDRAAVKDWIDGCGDQAQGKVVLDSLANLQRGEGWVWFPEGAHLVRSKFPAIKTFDSSATPEDGHQVAAPKRAADVDLSEIKKMLADAAAEAEANDPKALRKKIAELEKLLGGDKAPDGSASLEYARSMGWLSPQDHSAMCEEHGQHLADYGTRVIALGADVRKLGEEIDDARNSTIKYYSKSHPFKASAPAPRQREANAAPAPRAREAPAARQPGGSGLSKAERQLLIALAQNQPKALEQDQLAILAGYAPSTGHFNNNVGALRSKEYITRGWPVSILPAGLEALGNYERLPTGRALLDWWCNKLAKAERAILLAGAEAYPHALTKDELARRAGYEANTGHFNNSLGRLRTLQLLIGRGEIKASESLF